MHHDSTIRSDWLPMGISRAKALEFAKALTAELRFAGAIDYDAHSGRRGNDADYVSMTSPGGWSVGHPGSATIKVRGCTMFRKTAHDLARKMAENRGLVYGTAECREAVSA